MVASLINGTSDEDNITEKFNSSQFCVTNNSSDSGPLHPALGTSIVLLLYTFVMCINFGIIWYENIVPDTYRTLINKMAAVSGLYNMVFCTASLPVVAVRQAGLSRLPGLLCRLAQLGVLINVVQSALVHNEVMVLKYVYACCLSTVGQINEDLGKRILMTVNFVLGLMVALVMIVLLGEKHSIYMYCMGCADEGVILYSVLH